MFKFPLSNLLAQHIWFHSKRKCQLTLLKPRQGRRPWPNAMLKTTAEKILLWNCHKSKRYITRFFMRMGMSQIHSPSKSRDISIWFDRSRSPGYARMPWQSWSGKSSQTSRCFDCFVAVGGWTLFDRESTHEIGPTFASVQFITSAFLGVLASGFDAQSVDNVCIVSTSDVKPKSTSIVFKIVQRTNA